MKSTVSVLLQQQPVNLTILALYPKLEAKWTRIQEIEQRLERKRRQRRGNYTPGSSSVA